MGVKKSKVRSKNKSSSNNKTPIFVNDKKLLKIFGQSECNENDSDRYQCHYYCKSCVDVDIDTEYIFHKPFIASTNANEKLKVFIKSLKIYFEKHPDNCSIKNKMLKFIDYNLNSDGKISHELGGFSFELIKQLDMYNFIVKKFHKHFCLNIFDLDKKSKVELFCCDCKYKVLTQIPLNITENSSLPKHDCLTGTKLMNKKRSISAVVNNEADKLENEIEKKRQKRAVSEQIIGTEKQILNENEEKSYEKGNSENESDNQNKSNMIPKTFKLRNKDLAVGKESVKNNSTEKHQQSKAKLLIAKGKKKLQKNNSKRQMSIVDILQKGKQSRENKSLISHSSGLETNAVSTQNGRTLRTRASSSSKAISDQKHINPLNGDLIDEQISRLEPITNLDFNSKNDINERPKTYHQSGNKPSLPVRSISASAPNSRPKLTQLNLFKRSVSSQPLYLDEGFLSDDDDDEEEEKEEIKEKEAKIPTTKQPIWDSDIKLSLDLDDLDDDDEEEEEEEDNKEKEINGEEVKVNDEEKEANDDDEEEEVYDDEAIVNDKEDVNNKKDFNDKEELPQTAIEQEKTKRKTEYIPLSPQNLKHVHDVTTNNDDFENVNRIISNVSVDFAKINDFKNVKQNTKSKSPTLGTEVPAKTPERLSEQFDIIESLKSPIAHRKIKSPISSRKGNSPINIHSNSPKRNPILDDKSEHDLRNISLRNASIHSPKTTIYNVITEDKIAEPKNLNKKRKLLEDEVQLFKKDDYEGILSISQINIDKLESNNIQIDSNVLFDDEEDEDESDNSENESVIINAVDDINHSNLIQTEKKPEKVQKDTVISDNPIESPNIKEVAVSNNTSANSSSKKHNLNELEKNKVLEPSVNIEKLENEDNKLSEHIFNGNSSLKEDISVDGNKKSEHLQKANEVVKLSANLDDNNYEHSEEKQRVPLENLQNSLKIPILSAKEPEINVEFNLDFKKKKFNDSNNISQSQSVDAMIDVEIEEEDGENSEVDNKIAPTSATPKKQRTTSTNVIRSEKIVKFIDKLKALDISDSVPDKPVEETEKIADIEERNLSDDNQEKEVEILETDSDNEMVQEEAVISSSNQHSIEQKAFKQQQISKSRNKALILNNISNAMDLAILSSPIVSFYEKMLNFKTILETEKKEQQSIINAEYQERKNVLLRNHENLCSKIDNCNNLENLINLHKKLTQK